MSYIPALGDELRPARDPINNQVAVWLACIVMEVIGPFSPQHVHHHAAQRNESQRNAWCAKRRVRNATHGTRSARHLFCCQPTPVE